MDTALLAELAPDDDGSVSVRTVDPTAAREREGAVRLWRVKHAAQVLTALELRAPGRFAPVFRDAASSTSALRVAKGGVAVFFAREQSPAQQEKWASAAGVRLLQGLSPRMALVESPPGAAALALARRLARLDGVRAAMPDWWHPGVAR